jgi:hypothetical protein
MFMRSLEKVFVPGCDISHDKILFVYAVDSLQVGLAIMEY